MDPTTPTVAIALSNLALILQVLCTFGLRRRRAAPGKAERSGPP